MGCDIHAHIEIKVGGIWLYYSQPRIHRSYDLFGRMAGVRGDETPIALPRGLPDDISTTTKLHYKRWGIDAHSMSWLSSKEFQELIPTLKAHTDDDMGWEYVDFGYLFGGGWTLDYPRDRPEFLQDYRIVFWFDC